VRLHRGDSQRALPDTAEGLGHPLLHGVGHRGKLRARAEGRLRRVDRALLHRQRHRGVLHAGLLQGRRLDDVGGRQLAGLREDQAHPPEGEVHVGRVGAADADCGVELVHDDAVPLPAI